jgi:glycosyltransferase involved in cell wall biosynthesis
LESIAIVSEDISRPVDEGFKKATVSLAAAIRKMVRRTAVFTQNPDQAALEAKPLPGNKLLWGRAFARQLTEFDPEAVIYVPQAAATPMSLFRSASLRSQSSGKPVVLISLQRRTYPAISRPFLRLARPDMILVLSSRDMEPARSIGCKAKRVVVGVDLDVFRPPGPGSVRQLRAKYNLPDGKIILHVGHISPGRNLRLLRKIADEVATVLIVSSTATSPHPEIKAALRSPSVILLDTYVEHIEEIYRVVDGYVFPTFSPTDAIEIPLSVLEAMATNLPVVTAGFGGLTDLFEPGGGLFICSTEEEILEASRGIFEIEGVATRDKVLGLSWERAAETVLEAIAAVLP